MPYFRLIDVALGFVILILCKDLGRFPKCIDALFNVVQGHASKGIDP